LAKELKHSFFSASAIIFFASVTISLSTNDFPIGYPALNKKVFAIPPPIIIPSTLLISFFKIFSFVETLEPPIIARTGFLDL
jgi:hypothetical protein